MLNAHQLLRLTLWWCQRQGDVSHRPAKVDFDAGVEKEAVVTSHISFLILRSAYHHVDTERAAILTLEQQTEPTADFLTHSL